MGSVQKTSSKNPYDVLAAILYFYPEDEFKNDREGIHTAFDQLRKNHFGLLREFVFRDNLLFPRSKILDEVLSSLQPAFLGKINPTYDTYTIKKDSLKKFWDLKLNKVFKESEVKAIAKELHSCFQNS